MIQIIAIHMGTGAPNHLEHIEALKWVEVRLIGGPAVSSPSSSSRAEMYDFVVKHPSQAFASSANDGSHAYLTGVDNGHVRYVKTKPDSTTTDNLLSLPRY
jgi:hypothetical protein